MKSFHKNSRNKDGSRRTPILLYGDGSAEHTQLTPGWHGVMATDRHGKTHHFTADSDAGWPKLRWIDGRLAKSPNASCYYCGSNEHEDAPCPRRSADAERYAVSGKSKYPKK